MKDITIKFNDDFVIKKIFRNIIKNKFFYFYCKGLFTNDVRNERFYPSLTR